MPKKDRKTVNFDTEKWKAKTADRKLSGRNMQKRTVEPQQIL